MARFADSSAGMGTPVDEEPAPTSPAVWWRCALRPSGSPAGPTRGWAPAGCCRTWPGSLLFSCRVGGKRLDCRVALAVLGQRPALLAEVPDGVGEDVRHRRAGGPQLMQPAPGGGPRQTLVPDVGREPTDELELGAQHALAEHRFDEEDLGQTHL